LIFFTWQKITGEADTIAKKLRLEKDEIGKWFDYRSHGTPMPRSLIAN
jgi:hypothetical protein